MMRLEPAKAVEAVRLKYNLDMVILSPSSGADVVSGQLPIDSPKGLFQKLFGDKSAVDSLRKSLPNQILPRVWSQGALDCIVDILNQDVVVGLFMFGADAPPAKQRALGIGVIQDLRSTLGY